MAVSELAYESAFKLTPVESQFKRQQGKELLLLVCWAIWSEELFLF